MKAKFLMLGVLFISIGRAQDVGAFQNDNKKGIQFISASNWEEVLNKAKADNKIIFLDCYTTWCSPCKQMEHDVYPLEKVGAFFNEHFISVKVQMDKSSKDDAFTKSWYKEADHIEKTYNIDAFPTYVFLSPDGKLLHRASGAFTARKFLAIANDALSPETQSYALAAKYDPEKMDTAEMKKVALSIRRSAPELAGKIAVAYFRKLDVEVGNQESVNLMIELNSLVAVKNFAKSYINKLTRDKLLQKENINLITHFLDSSTDHGFQLFYSNIDIVDSVMNRGEEQKVWFAKNYVDQIIETEEVTPLIQKAIDLKRQPDWQKLNVKIRSKYNQEYADRLVIKGKAAWFRSQKKLEEYCSYIISYMDKYGKNLMFDWGFNEQAWTVFLFSKDKLKLEKALSWSNYAVEMNPNSAWIDTYANILYKLGRKFQALQWQRIAAKLDPENQEILINLNKMEIGEPTWSVK